MSIHNIHPPHFKERQTVLQYGHCRPKLPIGRESEFRNMNQFSGIGIVSLADLPKSPFGRIHIKCLTGPIFFRIYLNRSSNLRMDFPQFDKNMR